MGIQLLILALRAVCYDSAMWEKNDFFLVLAIYL
jgi:hypothetical protein